MAIVFDLGKGDYRSWIVGESEFQPEYLGKFETIFSLGNGYMGLRAATEECYGEETRGCYVAGVFDRFAGEVTELANIPDWTNVEITLDGERYNLKRGKILFYQRQLNIKDGYLLRNVEWQSPAGKITRLSFERFVSLSNIRLAALKVKISPLNYSGYIDIRSGIDGQVSNSGTQHFKEGRLRFFPDDIISMTSRTQESDIGLVVAARHRFHFNEKTLRVKQKLETERRKIFLCSSHEIGQEENFTFEKLVTAYTSRDPVFQEKKEFRTWNRKT